VTPQVGDDAPWEPVSKRMRLPQSQSLPLRRPLSKFDPKDSHVRTNAAEIACNAGNKQRQPKICAAELSDPHTAIALYSDKNCAICLHLIPIVAIRRWRTVGSLCSGCNTAKGSLGHSLRRARIGARSTNTRPLDLIEWFKIHLIYFIFFRSRVTCFFALFVIMNGHRKTCHA